MERMKDLYTKTVVPALMKTFEYKNINQTPKLVKVVINMGVGAGRDDKKQIDLAAADLALIANQKPVVTYATKSIAAFKIRKGQSVGVKVTLRADAMHAFLDKFFNVVLPRVRDFTGVNPNSFDGRGNFAMGMKEQIVFPEIEYDKIDRVRGMDIIIVTTAKTDEEGRALLRNLGMPFQKS